MPDNLLLLQEYFPTDLAKQKAAPPVESYPYPDVPAQAVEWGKPSSPGESSTWVASN